MALKKEKSTWLAVLLFFCVAFGITGCDDGGGGDKIVDPDPNEENSPGGNPPG